MAFFIVVLLLIVNIPLYKVYFRMMFESIDDFSECLRYSFTPDFISLFRGEYFKDYVGEFRIGLFFMMCAGSIWLEFTAINMLIETIL